MPSRCDNAIYFTVHYRQILIGPGAPELNYKLFDGHPPTHHPDAVRRIAGSCAVRPTL